MENMYDLDIAIEIIARMRVKKMDELKNTVNDLQKIQLQQEVDILRAEKNALYTNTPLQQSVIHKAFNLYAPVLRREGAF
jgi:hypothetical protein